MQRFIKQCKEKFYECYKKLDGKDVVLFAAGERAHMMVLAFKEMGIKANIRAILDNHCKEERYIEKYRYIMQNELEISRIAYL